MKLSRRAILGAFASSPVTIPAVAKTLVSQVSKPAALNPVVGMKAQQALNGVGGSVGVLAETGCNDAWMKFEKVRNQLQSGRHHIYAHGDFPDLAELKAASNAFKRITAKNRLKEEEAILEQVRKLLGMDN